MAAQPKPADRLAQARDRFVQAWGQMAGAWGVSRTMAEAHALLYIVGEPMNTDEVMDRLQISRGNASMSLRALVDWGLVTRVHKRGDRKEYFLAEQDVWTMLRTIIRERKKRELDPLLVSLHETRDLTAALHGADPLVKQHNARLDAMLEFATVLDTLADQAASPGGVALDDAARALADSAGGRP